MFLGRAQQKQPCGENEPWLKQSTPEQFISIMGSMTTPMNSPKKTHSLNTDNTVYTHTYLATKLAEEIEKLEHIYKHFQDCKKIHKIDLHVPTEHIDDTMYPQINNNIEYSLFENVIDSYYLDTQIRDDFTCTKACYVHNNDNNILKTRPQQHTHMIIYHNNLTH